MFGKHLRVVSTQRAVPKLELREYEIVTRNGKEFVIDGYGGAISVKDMPLAKIEIERL